MINIRRVISENFNFDLDILFNSEIMCSLTQLLDNEFQKYFDLQYEACWILVNLTAFNSSFTIFITDECKGVDRFINLLDHTNFELVELASFQLIILI